MEGTSIHVCMSFSVRDRNVQGKHCYYAINLTITGREDIVQTLHTDGNASGLIMEVNITNTQTHTHTVVLWMWLYVYSPQSSERDDGMTVDQEVCD